MDDGLNTPVNPSISDNKTCGQYAIVTIADRNYVIPTFVLILSLRFHKVTAPVFVLGIGMTEEEKQLFNQLPGTRLLEADPANTKSAATRKPEAILKSAAVCNATIFNLFDADCIVNGDITPYLAGGGDGFTARLKTPDEDGRVFLRHYRPDDPKDSVPRHIQDKWQQDVAQRETPWVSNTVCSGNFAIHRDHLYFLEHWHSQMMKVLPAQNTVIAYNYNDPYYFQLDESVLNSLLFFAAKRPPVFDSQLNKDPNACLLHLGPCNPRYWLFWRCDRLQFYKPVIGLLDWAKKQNYTLPSIPWALDKRFKLLVPIVAYGYEFLLFGKGLLKKILGK